MQTTVVTYYGTPLKVEYIIEGSFYPETRFDSAEYPEIIINSICTEDSEVDLQDILDWKQVEAIIELIEI